MDRDYFQHATQEALSTASRITSRAIAVAASGMFVVYVVSSMMPSSLPTAVSMVLAGMSDGESIGLADTQSRYGMTDQN
eukprot:scaffold363_cov209-Alexandrium_tamarense.AAC.18